MATVDDYRRLKIERRHLLTELGLATCAWSFVEDYLCRVILAAMRPADEQSFLDAYYAIPSAENKIRMADASICAALKDDPDLLAEWNTLLNRVNRKKKLRNELAHCQVISFVGPEGCTVFLVPYFSLHHFQPTPLPDGGGFDIDPMKHLYPKDIQQRGRSFDQIRTELDDFGKRLLLRLGDRKRKAPAPVVVPRRGSQQRWLLTKEDGP